MQIRMDSEEHLGSRIDRQRHQRYRCIKNENAPMGPLLWGKTSPYPMPRGYKASGHNDPVDRLRLRNFPAEGSATTKGHQVCVTGQDDGRVKLFRFPAFGFKQAFRSYIGHDVRFTYDDDYALSAGGPDMSIFQVYSKIMRFARKPGFCCI